MEYLEQLAAVENALRRIVDRIGNETFGRDYLGSLGVSEERKARWAKNRAREEERRGAGIGEQRALYYSDFSDIEDILTRNWPLFEPVLIDRQQTTVFLAKLRYLRNPDAHRRELSETEKALVIGMAGELRTLVTRYLSQRDTPDEYFPRLESVRDSLGNSFGTSPHRPVLRVGDEIEFLAEAWDPMGRTLEYSWSTYPASPAAFKDWSADNRFSWRVQPNQVANPAWVNVSMRGPMRPHAEGDRDASWGKA